MFACPNHLIMAETILLNQYTCLDMFACPNHLIMAETILSTRYERQKISHQFIWEIITK